MEALTASQPPTPGARVQKVQGVGKLHPHSRKWHEVLKRTAAWSLLPVIGSQLYEPETGDDSFTAYHLVQANCTCGSTLAIEAPAVSQ